VPQQTEKLGRVLITGGAGFIGSNLVRNLTASGSAARIAVLDNEVLGNRSVLDGFDVEFIHGDIRDQTTVRDAVKRSDTIVHLAADTRVMDSIENPAFNYENNVLGSVNLLLAMREFGVARLVNASTGGAILGEVPPPVHEDMVPRPLSPYGAAKLAVEGYCSAFAASYDLKIASLRFSNVYGPLSFHKGSVVATFLRNIMAGKPVTIYGDGSQIRDYVYVNDLCNGIVAALDSGVDGVYQLGTGIPTTLNELVVQMKDVTGHNNPFEVIYEDARQGEIKDTYCNIDKARGAFGFSPDTSLPEGLTNTWNWFLDQRS